MQSNINTSIIFVYFYCQNSETVRFNMFNVNLVIECMSADKIAHIKKLHALEIKVDLFIEFNRELSMDHMQCMLHAKRRRYLLCTPVTCSHPI